MNEKLSTKLGLWLCRIGFHKYRIVEVKFGFGTAGKVETVECERCGEVTTRRAK